MIEIGSGEDLEDAIDRKILGELLRDVLDTLTEKDREILVRYYYCYENVRQIAETLCLKNADEPGEKETPAGTDRTRICV